MQHNVQGADRQGVDKQGVDRQGVDRQSVDRQDVGNPIVHVFAHRNLEQLVQPLDF